MNPLTNRWAALFLVAFVMLGVAELVGSEGEGGVLSQAVSSYGTEKPPLPEGVVQVVEAPPTIAPAPVDEEPADDEPALSDDGTFESDDGVVEVIDDDVDDGGGVPVVVMPEATEEQEE